MRVMGRKDLGGELEPLEDLYVRRVTLDTHDAASIPTPSGNVTVTIAPGRRSVKRRTGTREQPLSFRVASRDLGEVKPFSGLSFFMSSLVE